MTIILVFHLYFKVIDAPVASAQGAAGHSARLEKIMAKGQAKKSREARKPKANKGAPKTNASQPSLKPGMIKGLENMKNS